MQDWKVTDQTAGLEKRQDRSKSHRDTMTFWLDMLFSSPAVWCVIFSPEFSLAPSSLLHVFFSFSSTGGLCRLVILVGRVLVAVDRKWSCSAGRTRVVDEARGGAVNLGDAEWVGGSAAATANHRDASDDQHEHRNAAHADRQRSGQMSTAVRSHRDLLHVTLQHTTRLLRLHHRSRAEPRRRRQL